MLTVVVWLGLVLVIVVVGLLAARYGEDSRPDADRPPDAWFGQGR